MPFCAKCGAQVAAGAASCTSCGAAQSPSGGGAGVATGTGLDENVAGVLSYVVGWVTGIIFFVIDKRPFVKFHAAQSIVVFGALFVLSFGLNFFLHMSWMMGAATGFIGSMLSFLASSVIGLVALIAWVLCMVKAYQGERYKLPILGDIAENLAGK